MPPTPQAPSAPRPSRRRAATAAALIPAALGLLLLTLSARSFWIEDQLGYVLPQTSPGAGRSITVRSVDGLLIVYGEFLQIIKPPDVEYHFSLYENPQSPGWRYTPLPLTFGQFIPIIYSDHSWLFPRYIADDSIQHIATQGADVEIRGGNSFHLKIPAPSPTSSPPATPTRTSNPSPSPSPSSPPPPPAPSCAHATIKPAPQHKGAHNLAAKRFEVTPK